MGQLLFNRWIQLGVAVAITAVVFVVIGTLIDSGGPDGPLVGPVTFATGGAVPSRGEGENEVALGDTTVFDLPLTAVEAVAAGWEDPALCSVGRGRYFQRGAAGEGEPYFLMYNSVDDLIGVYMYSKTEMPPPWKHLDSLAGGGGLNIIDFSHWGIFVYFQDSVRACRTTQAPPGRGGGSGAISVRKAVRSTPTPYVPPTPTPTAGQLLETVVAQMAKVASLSFTLTGDPEGTPLGAGIDAEKVEGTLASSGTVSLTVTGSAGTSLEVAAGSLSFFTFEGLAVTLSGIAGALQEPVDTNGQFIDNLKRRGISGTVQGRDLSALVPTAVADARVAVSLWFDEEARIRRLRVEGAVAPDDPPDAVRVLDVGGFGG